jgi:hypothetical protein
MLNSIDITLFNTFQNFVLKTLTLIYIYEIKKTYQKCYDLNV